MFIYKTKRINSFSAVDYYYADKAFEYYYEKECAKSNKEKFTSTLTDWNIPETMTKEKINPLQNTFSKYSTIFKTVASWSKANQIHNWFVENLQNGIDDYAIVIWRDEYGYKEKLKIVYDEDFRRPDLVISNQQFSYNNKLYQLLVIDQPMY